jgi:hypothetical protein
MLKQFMKIMIQHLMPDNANKWLKSIVKNINNQLNITMLIKVEIIYINLEILLLMKKYKNHIPFLLHIIKEFSN